ncbi:MAG TPA: Maf family protein [Methylophilaceae bacterium]|nr:Maf family protein [Methylophilaceae bacterium]
MDKKPVTAADSSRPVIYLASRSPRRADILQQLGVQFTVLPSDIDESQLAGEQPEAYVLRLATQKAQACAKLVNTNGMRDLPILAADTTVSLDGLILGKPVDDEDARNMLRRLSGSWHEVHSGVGLATQQGVVSAISSTRVQMAELSDAMIAAYIATGEPRDKAGAYGIQGLAGTFIRRIEGSYSGVMGLPIYETAELLGEAGISILGMHSNEHAAARG